MTDINNTTFKYPELAMHTIHLEASRSHRRLIFKRPELEEVRNRLRGRYPHVSKDDIPHTALVSLPFSLKEFMASYDYTTTAIKAEWMYSGLYTNFVNETYKERMYLGRNGDRNMYKKVVDVMGLSEYDMAFNMWMESVDRPQMLIKYDDIAYHRGLGCAVQTGVRMMSVVVDFEHIITVTVVI